MENPESARRLQHMSGNAINDGTDMAYNATARNKARRRSCNYKKNVPEEDED